MTTSDNISATLESGWAKLIGGTISWIFRGLIITVITLAGWEFRQMSAKIDGAAQRETVDKALIEEKADVVRSQSKLWEAIGSVTKSVNELTGTVSVLSTKVEMQNQFTNQQINDLKAQRH